MAKLIELGSKVSCPVTDDEGELTYRIGELVAINSRYATVKLGDETIKVGKTKVELIKKPGVIVEADDPDNFDDTDEVPMALEEEDLNWGRLSDEQIAERCCPHCGTQLSNGFVRDGDENGDSVVKLGLNEIACLACEGEFGPRLPPKKYEFIAIDGRKAKDNGDEIAMLLRGLDLNGCYALAAKRMQLPVSELINKYRHLNPGQQRMCIGNRLRGHYTKINKMYESRN